MVVFMGFGFGPPVQRASDDDHQGATRDAGFPHPQENFPHTTIIYVRAMDAMDP